MCNHEKNVVDGSWFDSLINPITMKNAKRPTCWNPNMEEENSRNICSRNTALMYPLNRKIHLLRYLRFHRENRNLKFKKKINKVQN